MNVCIISISDLRTAIRVQVKVNGIIFQFKAFNIVLAVKFTPFGVHYVLRG